MPSTCLYSLMVFFFGSLSKKTQRSTSANDKRKVNNKLERMSLMVLLSKRPRAIIKKKSLYWGSIVSHLEIKENK